MNKVIRGPLNAALGIAVELLYALCIILAGLFICWFLSLPHSAIYLAP